MNKKRRIKSSVIMFFMVICLFSLVFSIYKLVNWKKDTSDNKKIKQKIEESIDINADSNDNNDADEDYNIDWNELKKKNSDTVAYIQVPNTKINYAIVKTTNNDFYLNHNFYKKNNDAGWIFMNSNNFLDGTDKNITLFGHNRLDGSMFGTLKNTLTKKWQMNEQNHAITFITEQGTYKYQVFSTYKIKAEEYYLRNNFDDEEFSDFLSNLKSRSNYDYGISLNNNDQILTLSSCAIDSDYRIVLHAKLET